MSETIVEILTGNVYASLATAKVELVEVFATPPDTRYQIGGVDPTNNPAVLIWFDTLGA